MPLLFKSLQWPPLLSEQGITRVLTVAHQIDPPWSDAYDFSHLISHYSSYIDLKTFPLTCQACSTHRVLFVSSAYNGLAPYTGMANSFTILKSLCLVTFYQDLCWLLLKELSSTPMTGQIDATSIYSFLFLRTIYHPLTYRILVFCPFPLPESKCHVILSAWFTNISQVPRI